MTDKPVAGLTKTLCERLRDSSDDYVDCGTHCELELEAIVEIERLQARFKTLWDACSYQHSPTGAPYHEPASCSICRAMKATADEPT